MERKKITNLILSLICVTGITSCQFGKEKQGFYDYSKEYDLYRLPLIDPLELQSADKGFSWTFKSPYKQIENKEDLGGTIEKVGIYKNHIVLYTPSTYVYHSMNTAWFVINVGDKTEKAFIKEADYQKYLSVQGIQTVHLYDVQQVFKTFDTEKKLPPEWGNQPKKE